MRIGVMGAMEEEVALLRSDLRRATAETVGGRTYHTGTLYGRDVALVFSGWGKVAAASTVTTLLERYQAGLVLFSGVAGAAAPELRIGDVVIGSELIQHDLDARPLFKQFEVPLLGLSRFRTEPGLLQQLLDAASRFASRELASDVSAETLRAFAIAAPRVTAGLIASGDQFVSDPQRLAAIRAALPGLQCVEMEGAAVAQVCHGSQVPLGVIRVISDRADHSARIDFSRFIAAVASHYSRGIIRSLWQAPAMPDMPAMAS